MNHVSYSEWYSYLDILIKEFELPGNPLLDIGGGTGALALHFSNTGHLIDILDKSSAMLKEARKKKYLNPVNIYKGDMLSWNSKKKYGSLFCLHDTVNYLTSRRKLRTFFRNCAGLLEIGGGLIIDNTSEYNILENFNGRIISDSFEDIAYIWTNAYNKNTRIATIKLHFMYTSNPGRQYSEKHIQRSFTKDEILLASSPYFSCLGALNGFSLKPIHSKTEEEYYIFKLHRRTK
jgi:2-polyprenyl-3-methyl-5-hydroxy-6-metoxy-1,4-benzoquinol methylase